MRLLMDLFPCQTASRFRGIGRYTLSLAMAMARISGAHEFRVAANGLYPESTEILRQKFLQHLPPGSFSSYVHPERSLFTNHSIFESVAGTVIHRAYQAIKPEALLYPSPFEGWLEDGVVPLPNGPLPDGLRIAIVYDFIPKLFPDQHFAPLPQYEAWYQKRLGALHKFDLLLAISEATRNDAINILGVDPDRVVNISGAADFIFASTHLTQSDEIKLQRWGIERPFVLYTGNADYRKNLDGALHAYSLLSDSLRESHQFVLNQVGDFNEFRRRLKRFGLRENEVVVTGHITDEDLRLLYCSCKVFLFPSLYEGFGLPVLEAMACGAPVIASNNSSIPEVVGRGDVLFNANEPQAIADTLTRVLTDDDFRLSLAKYGPIRAREFSWENTAQLAWDAIATALSKRQMALSAARSETLPKKRIGFVSPLPPQKSGIADYSAELLPHLARHFEIDLFVEAGTEVHDLFLESNFSIFPHSDLPSRRHLYHVILYQFGNSPFHTHMLKLMEECPGVVVLHDFYLSNLSFDKEFLRGETGEFLRDIFDAHGLKGAIDYARNGHEIARNNWPINLNVLTKATSLIVHSPFHRHLLQRFYGCSILPDLKILPQLRKLPPLPSKSIKLSAREKLGISPDTLLFVSFGFVAPTKLNHLIIEAFSVVHRELGHTAQLTFIGEMAQDAYGNDLRKRITELGLTNKVYVTGYVDTFIYERYLAAADIAIQLRTDSRGETSRAVLDCLAYALPTIINDHGTNNDYHEETVFKINDPTTVKKLADAFIHLANNFSLRQSLAQKGRKLMEQEHHPGLVAASYASVLHFAWTRDERRVLENLTHVLTATEPDSSILQNIAISTSANAELCAVPRLLIDVTRINENDPRTGIERVIKNIIRELALSDSKNLHIELVYLQTGRLWRANGLAESIFELPKHSLNINTEISPRNGDILLMLDTSWVQFPDFYPIFSRIKRAGGKITTVVYDLIPLHYPDTCHQVVLDIFSQWLNQAVHQSDQIICISKTVADDVSAYLDSIALSEQCRPKVDYFHLGADLPKIESESNVRSDTRQFLKSDSNPLYLMVGTIEPRKGHAFVLDAFDQLWSTGVEMRLCIAGKEGWNVSEVTRRIRTHPKLGKTLFFLENPSDAEINLVYQSSTSLITASIAEGFGLPVVEAALHGIPVLASDIPVFREVGGNGAEYFSLRSSSELAEKIKLMANLSADERHAIARRIKVITWRESAQWLLKRLYNHTESFETDKQ